MRLFLDYLPNSHHSSMRYVHMSPFSRRGDMFRDVRQLTRGHTAVGYRNSSLGVSALRSLLFPKIGVACSQEIGAWHSPSLQSPSHSLFFVMSPCPWFSTLSGSVLRLGTTLGQDRRWGGLCPLEPSLPRCQQESSLFSLPGISSWAPPSPPDTHDTCGEGGNGDQMGS